MLQEPNSSHGQSNTIKNKAFHVYYLLIYSIPLSPIMYSVLLIIEAVQMIYPTFIIDHSLAVSKAITWYQTIAVDLLSVFSIPSI